MIRDPGGNVQVMTGEPWLYAAPLANGVLQLVAVEYAALSGHSGTAGVRSRDGTSAADAHSVVSPDCEAVNERGYRYCWRCVAELPGARQPAGTTAPTGRDDLL